MEFNNGSLEYFRGLPQKIGEFVTRTFLSPYPLMTPSEHPLDEPVEPVTDWPPTREQLSEGVNRWCDNGNYYNQEELDV